MFPVNQHAYLTNQQVKMSLKCSLEKLNKQNSSFYAKITQLVCGTQSWNSAQIIKKLLKSLSNDSLPVSMQAIADVSPFLALEDVKQMNFSQLKAYRGLFEIDDKKLASHQRQLWTKLNALRHSEIKTIKDYLPYFQNLFVKEVGVFESFVRNIPEALYNDLQEDLAAVLKNMIKESRYSDFSDDKLKEILSKIKNGDHLLPALKQHVPHDVLLLINDKEIAANKQLLMKGSGWFREAFESAADMDRFEIVEDDGDGFQALISFLMGQDVQIQSGHSSLIQMYRLGVRYRVKELMNIYDYKLTRCYECFGEKEKVEILKSFPQLKAFRKEANNQKLNYLRKRVMQFDEIYSQMAIVKSLNLIKSQRFLAEYAINLIKTQKYKASRVFQIIVDFKQYTHMSLLIEAIKARICREPNPFLSEFWELAEDDPSSGWLRDLIANYCYENPQKKVPEKLQELINQIKVSHMV